MSDKVDLREFVGGFIAESDQLTAAATAGLLEIELSNGRNELRPKTVRDLFRALHTIKGLAGMMEIEPIVELAHAFETVLRAADQAGGRLGPRAVELGLITVRAISERVRAVADGKPVPPATESLIDEMARVDITGSSPAPAPYVAAGWDRKLSAGERTQLAAALAAKRPVYTLTFAPSEATSSRGISIATVREALAAVGELIKVAPRSQPASEDAPAGLVFELLVVSESPVDDLAAIVASTVDRIVPVIGEAVVPSTLPELGGDDEVTPIGRSVVRVELSRLDDLQEQLAALVVSRFRLERQIAQLAAAGIDVRGLREVSELQGRQLRDLRRGILRARMVRLVEVLEPMSLIVRSLTKPGIKEVQLVLEVHGSELDKAVADRLLPALVHVVRNAVDHAIEPIIEREKAGKPRIGTVRISCREGAGNALLLSISDDGRGIDRAAVARRVGMDLADDHALLDQLTTPGFSTRETATETSGRGYGMDILRRIVVADLGGELSMSTEIGKGTTFALEVPLTIAIIDVFSFECGNQAFVVPVASIEEIFELGDLAHSEGPTAKGRMPISMIERRGSTVSVVQLGALLRIAAASARKALVVRRNGELLAFAVDRMLGRHEVVVRPIEDVLARAPGIAGATDLGDGRPTLLLDLIELGAGIASWREVQPS